MPYFSDHNVLFVHIPKNAGKAIENSFGIKFQGVHSSLGGRSLLSGASKLLLNLTSSGIAKSSLHGALDITFPAQHLTINEIELLAPDIFAKSKSRKFAVLRNPYTRAVSIFRHFNTNKHAFTAKNLGIFLEHWDDSFIALHQRIIKRAQVDFIFDRQGKVGVDKLIRFEKIDEDIKKLIADWGIEAQPLLQIGSPISDELRTELLTNSNKKKIERIFGCDFEKWESLG